MGNINFKFPFQRTVNLGYVKMTTDTLEAYGNNILLMIGTYSFERIDTDVTAALDDFLFEPLVGSLKSSIENRIRQKIAQYFPAININSLTVYSNDVMKSLDDNQILVTLSISLKTKTDKQLTLNMILP
jgi:hypothetical protein